MSLNLDPSDADSSGAWLENCDGERLPLHSKCLVGRGHDSHIVVDTPKTSRRHAVIHLQDEVEFWLLDAGSRNGTYRNNHRVIRPTRLHHGDRLMIGGESFLFQQPAFPNGHRDASNGSENTTATPGGDATVLDLRQQSVWLLIGDIEKFSELCREWELDRLAVNMGTWLQDSRRIVEKNHGAIPKYLGDGFLACWEDRDQTTTEVVAALRAFRQLQKESPMTFRIALHYGQVAFGEQSKWGEESMLGPEMNYIFRLEDLASTLRVPICLSSTAEAKLAPLVATKSIPGEHVLKGYAGTHRCFTVVEDF